MLTPEQVNEIADTPAGVVAATVRDVHDARDAEKEAERRRMGVQGATPSAEPASTSAAVGAAAGQQPKLEVKSVSEDGKVSFQAKAEPAAPKNP